MRFAEGGLYVEAYVKCANCGVLVYDSDQGQERPRQDAGAVYCGAWCRDWAARRAARRRDAPDPSG